MNDLVWVGNTLYPRWEVFMVIGFIFCAVVGILTAISMWIRP